MTCVLPPCAEQESFYWSKWLTFSASALVMLCAGLSYSYGIYSDVLKQRYGLSQLQVAGVGTAGNVGGYMAIFAGLFYDYLRGLNRHALIGLRPTSCRAPRLAGEACG